MREQRVRLIGRTLYGIWLRYPRFRRWIDARTAAFFDARAAEWDLATGALSATRLVPLEAGLAQLAGEPRRIADVGTGTGAGAMLLARKFPTAWIEGVDLSSEMLAGARATANRQGVAVRYVLGSADSLPLKRDSADLLTYVNAPVDFVEAYRALRQGGAMIVCFTAGARTPFYAGPSTLRRLAKRAGLTAAGSAGAGPGQYFIAFKPVRGSAQTPPPRPLIAAREEQIALIAHIPGAAAGADSTQPFEKPAELMIARRRKFKPFAATSLQAVQQAAAQAANRGELSVAYGDATVAARVFNGVAGSSAAAAWIPSDPSPLSHDLGLADDLNSIADLIAFGLLRPLGAIDTGGGLAFRITAQPVSEDRGPRAELLWAGGGATINAPFEAVSVHRDPALPEGILIRPMHGAKNRPDFDPFLVTEASIVFRSIWELEADGVAMNLPPSSISYRAAAVQVIAPAAAYAQ